MTRAAFTAVVLAWAIPLIATPNACYADPPVPLNPATFAIGKYTIGRTTLADIAADLGTTDERLEENGLVKKACYVLQKGPDRPVTIIEFESTVLGGLKRITGFTVRSEGSGVGCAQSPVDASLLPIGNGVTLGISKPEFKRLMSLPFKERHGVLTYAKSAPRAVSEEEARKIRVQNPENPVPQIDVTVRIDATFRRDRLIAYYVSRLETL